MNRAHSLAVLLLLAFVGGHLCQSETTPQTGTSTTTTTPSPKTTTTPPQTTTPAPKTTTPAPKTTTPAPKTTTPSPTPAPTPKIISGNITEDNHTCIRYEFTVHFNIHYNDTKNVTKETVIQLPLDSVAYAENGTCKALKESFRLSSKDGLITLNLTFGSNENQVFLDSILLTVVYNNISFPDIESDLINKNRTYTLANLNSFNVEKTHSYFCANVTIPKNDDGEVKVIFESLKLQAFMDPSQKGDFSSEHNCQNEINDVVPIAVGAALTGLVVIVMIAYFIGRRRSRRLAYQSV